MTKEIALIPVSDMQTMATAVAKSGLFGVKSPDQALALMLISQAEGRHPALAARDYDIIQGRPAKKAETMLRDFLSAGGRVEWHQLDDQCADATFSHPQGGTVRITWDMARAKAAGLGGKDMWTKFPRQMLRSRVVSEGVRTIYPAATSGMYVPEEVQDFEQRPGRIERDITPSSAETDEIVRSAIGMIESAASLEELDAAAKAIADEDDTVRKHPDVRRAFSRRKADILKAQATEKVQNED
jgi:hypothetical protein